MYFTNILEEDINNIIDDCNVNELLNKLKNKSVMITGSSGMIGSYLFMTLIKLNKTYDANINIILVDKKIKIVDKKIFEDKNIEMIETDIIDFKAYDKKIDYLIHAASPASPKFMKDYPVETNFANTIGTANTLLIAKNKNVKGYLFISSREVYGEPNSGQDIFTEDGTLGQLNHLIPRNGYAEGKKVAENMCCCFKEEYGINTKIVRLAHTYGPGMSIYDGRVQADFLNNYIHNNDIVLKSDGSSIRTYTYIADAITAIWKVLLFSKDTVYNISNENCITTIKELAETIINLNPEKKLKIVLKIDDKCNKGIANFKNGIVSSKKIINELKWKPRFDIEEGFKRTVNHLLEEERKCLYNKDK